MISKAVLDAMNAQIMHEMYSAYLYLSMAAYFESENLPGFAHWMRVQFEEEQTHAMKFYEYILDRSGKVELEAIAKPQVDFKSPLAVFEQALEHEQKVTSLINNIYERASSEKDVASQVFLQWFITEQIEEEKNASQLVDLLRKIGPSVGSLYQLDHRLSKRGGAD
jgi:ferritin